MSAHDLVVSILASLEEDTFRAVADCLRPYLEPTNHGGLLTPAEAAERLRLHPKTVVRMARDGRLPATKIGTGWRFHPDDLNITPAPRPERVATCAPARRRPAQNEPASVRAIRGDAPRRERSAA
jgi:excisionase family DNA binding protein